MVKMATLSDVRVLAEMASRLWDNHSVEDLENEFMEAQNCDTAAFFIKYVENTSVGFAQCGLRFDYVEGTQSTPVGYLEGIFVEEECRKNGYAKQLLLACENWARTMGCTEFASDCELSNYNSLEFHLAMGFDEANRIICFRKNL